MSTIYEIGPAYCSDQDLTELNSLAQLAEESSLKTRRYLSSFKGKLGTKTAKLKNRIPKCAETHMKIHKELEKSILKLQSKVIIPENIIETLQESQKVITAISKKITYSLFLKALSEDKDIKKYIDSSKLLRPLNQENKRNEYVNINQWQLNYALLYSAYKETQDENVKSSIRFLMMNYLAKAAFLNENVGFCFSDQDIMQRYEELLQIGPLTFGGMYHRLVNSQNSFVNFLDLRSSLGSGLESVDNFILTDSITVDALYNVAFIQLPSLENEDAIIDFMIKEVETRLDKVPKENLVYPFLIDVTEYIGQSMVTNKDPQKIEEYQQKQKEIKVKLDFVWNKVSEIIQNKYPQRENIRIFLDDYLRTNTIVVSRAWINDHIALCGMLDSVVVDEDFKQKPTDLLELKPASKRKYSLQEKLMHWAEASCINIGAVNFRRAIIDIHTNPLDLIKVTDKALPADYTVQGKKDIMMYVSPDDLTKTKIFQSLNDIAEDKTHGINRAEVLLSKATVALIKTLVNKISKEDWLLKQQDPAIRQIIQTTIFRIMQHLATAIHQKDDFRQFVQGLDRVHSELTALLLIYSPFDIDSFDEAYRSYLDPIFPNTMKPEEVGIARSAMNVFSGINSAVITNNAYPIRVLAPHSYYEESDLVVGAKTLQEVLEDDSIEQIDLFTTEFYHNMDIDSHHTHYQKGLVIEDIKNIFIKKPKTDHLTVAIDATIDFTKSEDIREVLREFQQEINDGRLNIIVFRSGQKFDMLGFDNYFGGLYYIVNNGDKKWDEFKKIKTNDVFHTDSLSQQYFTWLAESGLDHIDHYKKLIFDNAKKILELVPESLKPESNYDICVCSFDEDVITPFIDLKIELEDEALQDDLRKWVQERFMTIFTKSQKLVYRRGSFGFAHPNITWILPKMRINPGLDPDDIRLYGQFFNELAEKVKEYKKESIA